MRRLTRALRVRDLGGPWFQVGGDRQIAGQLTDAATGTGIPGVEVTGWSREGWTAVCVTASDGQFGLPVASTVREWTLGTMPDSAAFHGYVNPTPSWSLPADRKTTVAAAGSLRK